MEATVQELNQRTAELIAAVERGGTVTVTRDGRHVATILSPDLAGPHYPFRTDPMGRVKYAFRFTTHAQRQLRSIGQVEAMRILSALTALGDDPFAEGPGVKTLTGHDGLYRLRRGPTVWCTR